MYNVHHICLLGSNKKMLQETKITAVVFCENSEEKSRNIVKYINIVWRYNAQCLSILITVKNNNNI